MEKVYSTRQQVNAHCPARTSPVIGVCDEGMLLLPACWVGRQAGRRMIRGNANDEGRAVEVGYRWEHSTPVNTRVKQG